MSRHLDLFNIPRDPPTPDPYNPPHCSMTYTIPPCVSSTEIKHPRPSKPCNPNLVYEADFVPDTARLSSGDAGSSFSDGGGSNYSENSHRSSSKSQYSDSSNSKLPSLQSATQHNPQKCHCERYGIIRAGDRVKLDCGGIRCDYVAEIGDSDCSESADNEDQDNISRKDVRRWGVIFY